MRPVSCVFAGEGWGGMARLRIGTEQLRSSRCPLAAPLLAGITRVESHERQAWVNRDRSAVTLSAGLCNRRGLPGDGDER